MRSPKHVWLKPMPSTTIRGLKVWFLYHSLVISWRLPRRNLHPWRNLVSSEGQTLCGPPLSIWSRRRMVHGDPVVIIVVSSMSVLWTDILFSKLDLQKRYYQVPFATFASCSKVEVLHSLLTTNL